jgi:hypothetical protein
MHADIKCQAVLTETIPGAMPHWLVTATDRNGLLLRAIIFNDHPIAIEARADCTVELLEYVADGFDAAYQDQQCNEGWYSITWDTVVRTFGEQPIVTVENVMRGAT